VFSTLCQGYADDAHQYRGIFEYLFLSHKSRTDLADLAIELFEAHRQQEAKWARARLYRGPSERLPNMFRTSLPWLATGRVLTDLVERLPNKPKSKNEVERKLEEEANRLLDDYRREGEAHARFTGDDLRGTTAVFKDNQAARIVKKFERKFGDIHEEIQP
jgi:hypothetical protein